jgi:hypothetical protein
MTLFNDIIKITEDILIEKLSKRLSKQLNIDEKLIKNALEDKNFYLTNEEIEKENEEIEKEFIYDFKNDKIKHTDEEFWKHKKIKIENKSYFIHKITNLILDIKNDELFLIGLQSKSKELIEPEELPKYVIDWCKLNSIN